MTHVSPSSILLSVVLAVICVAHERSFSHENDAQVSGDKMALPFWENPDKNYVSTAWPDEDGDILAIWDMPKLEKGSFVTAPPARNDGISVGELGIDGGNKDVIVQLAQEISYGMHGEFDSLLISHKGKLLFESYYSQGRINMTHPQASATKAYTALALGRAIQLGYLTMADLDKPLVEFFVDLDPANFVKGVEKITLHQALTMRTGIRISEQLQKEFEKDPARLQGQGLVQTLFEQSAPVTSENLSAFAYGNYGPPLVMQVIDTVVPGTAEDFIKDELLGKMGITNYEWLTEPSGLMAAGWKTSFSSRDMMKFGALAMNKGKWNGEQLLPEAYVAKATSRLLFNGDDDIFGGGKNVSNQGYGYYWWSGDLSHGGKSYFSASAQGGGGQFIILIEELDLIVVSTAHDRNPVALQITAEKILPAFVQ